LPFPFTFLQGKGRNFSDKSSSCIQTKIAAIAEKETAMFVIVKWIAVAIITGFAWLVLGYTIEYFRPYKKMGPRFRKK
jgi:apolipoprotein N-acyltransferase